MIKRIVKLTFKIEEIERFQEIFEESKNKIASFPGCDYVELLQQADDPRVFFTYSLWRDVEALDDYRHSELFQSTWAKTKVLFDGKPEAWSLNFKNRCDIDEED